MKINVNLLDNNGIVRHLSGTEESKNDVLSSAIPSSDLASSLSSIKNLINFNS